MNIEYKGALQRRMQRIQQGNNEQRTRNNRVLQNEEQPAPAPAPPAGAVHVAREEVNVIRITGMKMNSILLKTDYEYLFYTSDQSKRRYVISILIINLFMF